MAAPAAAAESDDAAWLFDPHSVVEIDLQLPQESIDALAAEPDEYVDATIAFRTAEDAYGPYAVGARLKGSIGSFRPLTGKAAFKVKASHSVSGQRLFGLKTLTLNNMVQDPSMIQETLSYQAFRAGGVPAPRTGYAFVRVNGSAYGVYLNVETLDDVSLPRFFPSTEHLYEAEYGVDLKPGDAERFEVDEGDDEDLADVQALISANAATVGDWSDRVDDVADLDEMTRMWALEKYVGHWDSYTGIEHVMSPNNYYLHSDETGRFSMLPWGTDQTWSRRLEFDGGRGLMFNACLADASCAQAYRRAVRGAADAVATLGVDAEAIFLASMLAPWHALDRRTESSTEAMAAGVQRVRSFAALRPGDVARYAPAPARGQGTPPRRAAPVVPSGAPLTVKSARASGGVVKVRLGLAAAGQLRLRGTARLGGAMHTACTARADRAGSGDVTLRCRLNAAARRGLRRRSLRLKLRTWFAPDRGGPVADVRRLTVRRTRPVARP